MKKNKKGFTLVELVIVVAVMAVLVAVAIPTVTSITKTAKDTVANTNAKTIESIIKLAEADKNKSGNVEVKVDEDDIVAALVEAKLGIAAGSTFVYNEDTGTVKSGVGFAASTVKEITITFAENNGVTAVRWTAPDSTATTGAVQP